MNNSNKKTSSGVLDPQRCGRSYRTAALCAGFAALLFFALIFSFSLSNSGQAAAINEETAILEENTINNNIQEKTSSQVEITLDKSADIPFYYCQNVGSSSSASTLSIVLLHGARFTKEDWKKAPQHLLDKFCSHPTQNTLNVYAVDLPQNTDRFLQHFLSSMTQTHNLQLPVSLVTPSASGATMMSWLDQGSPDTIPSFIHKWIPVAAARVVETPPAKLKAIHGKVPVLAIVGSQDEHGKLGTSKLEDVLDAKVLELEGRHPCYLDSPEEFVQAVVEFVDS